MTLTRVRREYRVGALLESRTPGDPLALFRRWLDAALAAGLPEATSMALATSDERGRPSARMVLLKGAGREGFVFYTNQASRKGRELAARPGAALVFWWPAHERQVRVEGRVEPLGDAAADAYFAQRPRAAQLGAWASAQSRHIADRAVLERGLAAATRRFAGREVPRPPRWGGYRLAPRVIEFWQGREGRLHDRLRYRRRGAAWIRDRLAP